MPSEPASRSPRAGQAQGSIDRRLFSHLGPARRALATSVAVGLVTTLALLAQMLLLAHLLGWAMSSFPGPFPTATVLALLGALLVRVVVGGVGEAIASSAGLGVTAQLRAELLGALAARGPVAMVDERTGALVLTSTRGLRALEPYFARYLPAIVVAAAAPPLALVVLGIIDWPSALIALGLAALVPFAMIRLGRRAAAESDRQWRRLSSMSARYLELIRGIPTLRALGRIDRARKEVIASNEAVASSTDATLRAAMTSSAALEFLAGVGVGLVAMLAGLRLLHGSFSVTAALAVILVTPEVFLPLRRAGAEFHASTEGRSAAVSIFEALDALERPAPEREPSEGSLFPVVTRSLSADYGTGAPVLVGLNLEIEEGTHLVLVGPSGSGKSTALAVLCGFLEPAGGVLGVGGQQAPSIDWHRARASISYLPQVPHVFARSLRDNLTLGAVHEERALIEALDLVGLAHLAGVDHGGLDRPMAEGGRSISGGERQRLGLARVLLQDRPLVLLDEPTSHLDEVTVAELRVSLAPWLAGRAVLETTHRAGLLVGGTVVDLAESSMR